MYTRIIWPVLNSTHSQTKFQQITHNISIFSNIVTFKKIVPISHFQMGKKTISSSNAEDPALCQHNES